ncbi:MAG TPA: lipid-A-disaccharide synthase, partial [Devosia sp.]|nr:lipid-A-disaccharide synthase [Devosia sp.]
MRFMPGDDMTTGHDYRLFILAGEASGDRLGAGLLAALKNHASFLLQGVGGEAMAEQGLASLFPMTDLAVMGYVDVVRRLPLLLWRVRQVIDATMRFDPDLVVLVDAQVFSKLVARGLRKRGFGKPILLYSGPTVWAHKPERARAIRPLYDEVMALFPFEPAVMENLGGPACSFVGHPAFGEKRAAFGEREELFLLMPGSRVGELRRHMGMFGQIAGQLHIWYPEQKFVLPTLGHIEARVRREVENWPVDVRVVTSRPDRERAFMRAKAALTVAGTATLELCAAGVPMVSTYVMDAAMKQIEKRLDLKFFSLPNLILDRPLVPERLLDRPRP